MSDWLSGAGDWLSNLFSSSSAVDPASQMGAEGGSWDVGQGLSGNFGGGTINPTASEATAMGYTPSAGNVDTGRWDTGSGTNWSGISSALKDASKQLGGSDQGQQKSQQQSAASQALATAMNRGGGGQAILNAILTLRNNKLNEMWANAQSGQANKPVLRASQTRGLLGM
jgi:hypothetical protein